MRNLAHTDLEGVPGGIDFNRVMTIFEKDKLPAFGIDS
jgi:hypothetical protein